LGVGSWGRVKTAGSWEMGVGSWGRVKTAGRWEIGVGSWGRVKTAGSWEIGVGSWELGVGEESRVRQMGDRMTMEKCEKNLLLPGS
jgi:hypothetical protein